MNHRRRLKVDTAYAVVAKIFNKGTEQDIQKSMRENAFVANACDNFSGELPANLMLAILLNEQLTMTSKIDLSFVLLEKGFMLVNHYSELRGIRGKSVMDYLTIVKNMFGVDPQKHTVLLAAMIKIGGSVFVEKGTEYMWYESPYERAERDFPYLLGENGGPFPVLERDILGDFLPGYLSWSHPSTQKLIQPVMQKALIGNPLLDIPENRL